MSEKMTIIRNIKRTISKIFITVIIIFSGLFLLFIGKKAYNEFFKKRSRVELFQSRISAEIKKISRIIESVQRTPQDLAYILEFQDIDNMEMRILLESVLFNTPELIGCAIAFEPYQFHKDSMYYAPYLYRSGDVNIYTDLNDPEYDYIHKDWYLVPKTLMKPTWSEPYYDTGGGTVLMSTYSVPFYKIENYKEKFKGIVTVDVSVEWLTGAVKAMGANWNGHAILMSENGTIITSPYKDWTYNETIFTLASEMNLPVLREIGRELQKGKSGLKQINTFENQKDWWVFYSPININKWGFIFLIQKDKLYNNENKQR